MHDILIKLQSEDRLAQLFNAYLEGLSTLEIVFTPRETMRECRQAFASDKLRPTSKHTMSQQAKVFYELTVLNNALHGLHRSVIGAVTLLEDFFTTYQGDLHAYAVQNRLASIEQYGSEDETDWYREDPTNEQEEWKIVRKEDPQSLAYYTLHHELGAFFNGHESRGEYIGTSGPEDFAAYTQAVATQTETSFRKLFGRYQGQDLPIYRQVDGELTPIPLADQIEDELNEDIQNARLADVFNSLLTLSVGAADLYQRLSQEQVDDYRTLLGFLHLMRDVTAAE